MKPRRVRQEEALEDLRHKQRGLETEVRPRGVTDYVRVDRRRWVRSSHYGEWRTLAVEAERLERRMEVEA